MGTVYSVSILMLIKRYKIKGARDKWSFRLFKCLISCFFSFAILFDINVRLNLYHDSRCICSKVPQQNSREKVTE